jgi:YHS domain-containing protein
VTRTKLGQLRDPVCGMMVAEGSYPLNHLHIKYAFCSEHCRERFKKWPHLFVGDPAHGLSEKQTGKVVRKAHKIKLVNAVDPEKLPELRQSIESLMGVEAADISGDQVVVVYDLVQVSLSDIENTIIAGIGDLREGITDKIRRTFIHYSEECELDNLAHLAGHYRH